MAERRKPQRSARGSAALSRQATYLELQTLLGKHPRLLQRAIGLPGARLMLPVDGRGARILVGVNPDQRDQIPSKVTMAWRGRRLVIPLEVDEKYLSATIF